MLAIKLKTKVALGGIFLPQHPGKFDPVAIAPQQRSGRGAGCAKGAFWPRAANRVAQTSGAFGTEIILGRGEARHVGRKPAGPAAQRNQGDCARTERSHADPAPHENPLLIKALR